MPDTVIPGTPGTEPTVIAGTPATPPSVRCPDPPRVISERPVHVESFVLSNAARIGGQPLPKGRYDVTWEGLGPTVEARITRSWLPIRNKQSARLPVLLEVLGTESPKTEADLRANPDGSFSLKAIRFKGRAFRLHFD